MKILSPPQVFYQMIAKANLLDESTFRQLRESGFRLPEITEVIFDSNKMLEMGLTAIDSISIGFDIVWDKIMFNFLWKHFKDGIHIAEKQAKEKGVRLRLIVEISKENMDFIKSIKHHEIRHLEGTRGNFAILDSRCYMVQVFHNETEPPAQAFFSNSKRFVDTQQELFNKLWEMAIPISLRQKELEHHEKPNYCVILTDYAEIQNKVNSIIEQSRREMLIRSPNKILHNILGNSIFINQIASLLQKGAAIRVLTDSVDEYLLSQFAAISNINKNKGIQLEHTTKFGAINEMIMINDGKFLAHLRYGQGNKLVASFSNETHQVMVQEILFEKHWNEIKRLEIEIN